MAEQEYRFEENAAPAKSGLGSFIWNSQTKEFLGRNGMSWAKVSFFYSIFYACLGAFFIGMLAVFFQIMPKDKPTYFGESSTMANKGLNPGLGFRPQVDVEDNLIRFNPNLFDNNEKHGFKAFEDNLKIFLGAKYDKPVEEKDVIQCEDGKTYKQELASGKSCEFDYKTIFASTNCTLEKHFGYNSNTVCILVKMNKIVSWLPESKTGKVKITCEGETSADKDNILDMSYHSENNLSNKEGGFLDFKYFPYYSQDSYRAPFVFAEVSLVPNTLVNVRCRAFADNIDNEDRMNLRGMTKFAVFLENTQ